MEIESGRERTEEIVPVATMPETGKRPHGPEVSRDMAASPDLIVNAKQGAG